MRMVLTEYFPDDPGGFLIGLVVAIFVFVPSILKRLLSIFVLREDSSTSFRMNVYNSSISMFKDNWLMGIGTGNKTFREIYGLYMVYHYWYCGWIPRR